ncbi:uncharacterized protein, partial [Pituophis catenifer annectens]|uniref:uncharacterized protein n=1 Tax=Pituophis catenifer annectens TaxID=94852 RepID=UPI0039931CBA
MRCALEDSGLNFVYWVEAVRYTNYTLNRVWSSVVQKTPYEVLYGHKPCLAHLHIFGVMANVHVPKELRRKGDGISVKLRFVGYEQGSKAFRFAYPNGKLMISRSATFHEGASWSKIHANEILTQNPSCSCYRQTEDVSENLSDDRDTSGSGERVAERSFSDFQPLAKATRLEQEEAMGEGTKGDNREIVFEDNVLELRSVTSSSEYACSQKVLQEPSEFVTLGARPKQTAEQNYSHAERETIHYSPLSSKLTLEELAMKAYRDRIKFYEQELSQAKMAISMLEQDKAESRDLRFSKGAILSSSSEPKTLPLVDSVSGQLRQRALHTSHESLPDQVTYEPAMQSFLVTGLPEAKGTAPSAGESNLLQEAEMPQVFPQAQTQTPPGGVGVLLDGTQPRLVQQRQMTASPAGHANIADQAQMATGIQQIPMPQQLQMPAYVPQPQMQLGPPPGPPPMAQPRPFLGPQQAQQIPQAFLPAQPAYQMQAPYQAFSVSPLTGESKLKMSGHNYKAWVSEITLLLLREGTQCMIFNPPGQPWDFAIRDLEIRARTTLLMSMDTELQVTFPPNTTAQQIWAQLENCYRPVSIESSCLLMSELHGSRLKPGEQIGGHLTKLKGLRTELRERGHNIEDIQMISIIINSLNYEWKDAVTKINQVPIAQCTVDNVCRLLIEEEAFMLATPHLRGPPASRASSRRLFRGRTYAPRMPRCYTCDCVGHATWDC